MADRMLHISWGEVVRGREEHALEVFNEAVGFDGRLQQERRIESMDVGLLIPNGGTAGMIVLKGSAAQMNDVREDAEFRRNMADAAMVVYDLRITQGYCYEGVADQMAIFAEASAKVPAVPPERRHRSHGARHAEQRADHGDPGGEHLRLVAPGLGEHAQREAVGEREQDVGHRLGRGGELQHALVLLGGEHRRELVAQAAGELGELRRDLLVASREGEQLEGERQDVVVALDELAEVRQQAGEHVLPRDRPAERLVELGHPHVAVAAHDLGEQPLFVPE